MDESSSSKRKRSLEDSEDDTHVHQKRISAVMSSKESCNGVLFVFQTKSPSKILLKLDEKIKYTTISFSHLLPKNIPPGTVKLFSSTDRFFIYVYVFEEKRGCSSAKDVDFDGVKVLNDYMDSSEIISKMKGVNNLAAWSYYCLDEKPPSNVNFDTYVFPQPDNEFERVVCLKEKIKQKYGIFKEGKPTLDSYSINIFQKHSNGYCEFSGGGDLLLVNSNSTLTIQSSFCVDNTEPSPNNSVDEILTEVIEAKSCLEITPNICHQIYANMLLGTVDSFMDKIKSNFFTKADILPVHRLIGYGMICTGACWFAFYKIIIDLKENEVTICTKIEPSCRTVSGVVKLMDFCLDYFLAKPNERV